MGGHKKKQATDEQPEPTGYVVDPSTRNNVSLQPVGYGVSCPKMLVLKDHKIPFPTKTEAFRVLKNINSVGLCPHFHEVVPVFATYAGAVPDHRKEAK